MASETGLKQVTFASVRDMPPLAVSLATTRYNKTGSWRRLRPVYGERGSPCDAGCPNGNGVRLALQMVAEGRVDDALDVFRQTSPLPGVCGRVCYHPCESSCNRGQLDEPLAVQAIERFVAEHGATPAAPAPNPSHRSVAVVGGGPAGLSASYHLARLGHRVVLFEAQSQLGGLLRYGIPSYRLPRHVLDREIDLLLATGVEARTGQRLGHDFGVEDLSLFDAVFLAVGAQRSRRLGLPAEDAPGMLSGLALLRAVAEGQPPAIGRRVVVVGGGNTAVDSARVARRLGAEVTVVYRRTKEEMPAIADEVVAAEEEGIAWRFQAAPVRVVTADGRVSGMEFVPTRAGPVDAGGRPGVETAGPAFTVDADTVIAAIGEDVDRSLLPAGTALADQQIAWQNGRGDTLWMAGGDFAGSRRRVVDAMADGRHAALAIDRHLRGITGAAGPPGAAVRYEELNTEYFWPEPRVVLPEASPAERARDFREVVGELGLAEALHEASRCFSCGACTHCDNCWLFCPDIAVHRSDGGYSVDLDYCKGCGVCAVECPRSVISMHEEVGA